MRSTPIFDLHTHLYPPAFGPLMLWGIDELLTYHYLIGETIRASRIAYDAFWAMTQAAAGRPHLADAVSSSVPRSVKPAAAWSPCCSGWGWILRRKNLDELSRRTSATRRRRRTSIGC